MIKIRAKQIRSILLIIIITAFFFLATVWDSIYYRFAAVPEEIQYLGSFSCENCHQAEYDDWYNSLHRKMMRRVAEDGAILADFDSANTPAGLHIEDAHWVIGSKWEQQFMGHDGRTETLLPGAWNVASESWKTKSWDGWSEPFPLQRCHGCHTVGLDLTTGDFVEAGISCESCHGPGQWHVKSKGIAKIHSGLEAEQCGQCHLRGRSVDGATFFPHGFKPGQNLDDFFVEWEPDYIQNSSAWWGNGRERKRHQQYTAWKVGGHVNALQSLTENYSGKYGEVTPDCLQCHSAEGFFATDKPLKLEDAQNGITCSVCHQVHGDLDKPRAQCADCHTQGAYYHQEESLKDHIPCPLEEITCVDCHMPLTVKNGGYYSIRTHHPGIVEPKESEQFGVPSSCANSGCHKNTSVEELTEKFNHFYSKPTSPIPR